MPQPEIWLRGPVADVAPLLQPVAHGLLQAGEEARAALAGLTPAEVWARPGGAASAGYHARHAAGSLDRLFTYARAEPLSRAQRDALLAESAADDAPDVASRLAAALDAAVEQALQQLRHTAESTLLEPRPVGRAQLPSTVLGLLFHAAEHTRRHAGQIVSTARIVRGGGGGAPAQALRTLGTVLRELVQGPAAAAAWVLNPGDSGLLRSLEPLSAGDASAVPGGGRSSVAAHVDHVCYGLELLNRWNHGEDDPFTTADYGASWRRVVVTEGEWVALRDRLRREAEGWLAALQRPRDVSDASMTAIVASVAHLAYHLGAVRQIAPALRGPRARD